MQAQHIRAAAKAHRGGTLLVVIGYFHKPDLKGILSSDASIRLVEPSTIWSPSLQDAERVTSTAQLAAILRFNLLGQQSQTGNMNWEWMKQTLHMFEHDNPGGEAQLYRLRLNELTGHETDKELVEQYRTLVDELPPNLTFVWTGVKDDSRVDSYFDPFGNLTVRQRAMIELIRLLRRGEEQTEATRLAASLIQEVGGRKGFQLQAYISMFLPRS
jgi:hypothetical protein